MLHVPRHSLQKTLNNLNEGLKPNGVIYVSFKLGNGERKINGRQFTDLNENSLIELIQSHKNLFIEDLWITTDKRPDKNEHWINAILSQTS